MYHRSVVNNTSFLQIGGQNGLDKYKKEGYNKRKKGKCFLYFTIKPLLEYIEKTEMASTVIHIGKNDFNKFKVALPEMKVLDKFDEMTNPLIEKYIRNIEENFILEQIRDILLPKLMDGVIDLDKVETL